MGKTLCGWPAEPVEDAEVGVDDPHTPYLRRGDLRSEEVEPEQVVDALDRLTRQPPRATHTPTASCDSRATKGWLPRLTYCIQFG